MAGKPRTNNLASLLAAVFDRKSPRSSCTSYGARRNNDAEIELVSRVQGSRGGDLASLADIMGHSDVRVTWSSYAIYRTEELQAKHARLSPIARLVGTA